MLDHYCVREIFWAIYGARIFKTFLNFCAELLAHEYRKHFVVQFGAHARFFYFVLTRGFDINSNRVTRFLFLKGGE